MLEHGLLGSLEMQHLVPDFSMCHVTLSRTEPSGSRRLPGAGRSMSRIENPQSVPGAAPRTRKPILPSFTTTPPTATGPRSAPFRLRMTHALDPVGFA